MSNPLFSTYSQGENRVTASILATFERISFALVEHILQALCQESASDLLEFRNQPPGPKSTPDAVIRASFAYWIETKIVPNHVRRSQIEAHLQALDAHGALERQRLLVLTPDTRKPPVLDHIDDERLAWANFATLIEVLSSLTQPDEDWLISNKPLPNEREQALLRELAHFLSAEKLIGMDNQVLVVPARIALAEYLKYHVYICQPNRTFQPCAYLAFYADGQIHPQVPRILGQVESVVFSEAHITARSDLSPAIKTKLLDLLAMLKAAKPGAIRNPALDTEWRDESKVIFLSSPDSEDTLHLPHPIENDLVAASGRTVAFVQGQRYVPLAHFLRHPHTTSELLEKKR